MSGAGHVADMNNRVRQNRSIKPSNRARFKDNRGTIYSDSVPTLTKLDFKKVSKIELRKIKEEIKNRAFKDRTRETYIFLSLVIVLLVILILIVK